MTKKNVETPIETDVGTVPETDETDLKHNVETEEDSLSASVINKVFHQRMKEAMSLREIAEENGLSLSTVQRMLEGIEVQQEPEPSHQEAKFIVAPSPIPQEEIEPTQIPDGYTLTPAATPEEYQKFSKMDKSALVSEVVNLKAANRSLQTRAILRKGDGEPSSDGYGSENRELGKQKARIWKIYGDWMEQQTIDNMAEKMRNPKGATKDVTVKDATEMVFKAFTEGIGTALKLASSKEGMGLSDYVNLTNVIRTQATKEIVATAGGNKSEVDLKLEEMRENHDIDMEKLKMEWQKYQDSKQSTQEIIGTVKDVVKVIGEGPIGRAIGSMGEAKANQIMRHGQPPKVISINCPGCGKPFKVVEGSRQVVCPGCNVVLQLNQPSQPPPQAPIEQPSEPQAPIPQEQPSPSETRNETVVTNIEDLNKKPEQKHPDVLTDF
jgi:uncharacterized Zn finger protein (UPF0148 family)